MWQRKPALRAPSVRTGALRDTSDIFFADAFRDAFGGKSPFPTAAERPTAQPAPPANAAETTDGATNRWANALESQLLIDEIKAIATRSQNHSRSARSFADDARDATRQDFAIAATLFCILDEWEGEVRFKPQAAAASRALSEAARVIANPSGEALDVARRTSADLTDIVRGNQPLPADAAAPSWQQLVKRDDFMWRLEMTVEEAIADGLESEKVLRANQDELAREANLAVALLAALRQETAVDAEREDYAEFARAAQREATALRAAITEVDLARSQAGLQKLRQACQACHEVYQ